MGLTVRQREVIYHLASGNSNKLVARSLSISVSTVNKHRQNIYRHLGINNLAKLTSYALVNGIIRSSNEHSNIAMRLTPRERQIAKLTIRGFTNLQIADKLSVTYSTVRKHRENIYAKCAVSNVSQLAIQSAL